MSADASWSEAISNAPEVLVFAIVAVVALLALIYWIVTRKAPAGDHGIRLKAEPLPPECQGTELYRTARAAEGIFDRALLEKIVLTGLISVIFAQYLVSDDVKSISVLLFVAGVRDRQRLRQPVARAPRPGMELGGDRAGRHVRRQLRHRRDPAPVRARAGHDRAARAAGHQALLRLPVHA